MIKIETQLRKTNRSLKFILYNEYKSLKWEIPGFPKQRAKGAIAKITSILLKRLAHCKCAGFAKLPY